MSPRALGAALGGAVALFLLAFPLFGSQFWVVQIGIQSLFLGIVALSLIFLAGYGGMVSLAQTALFGLAGYGIGIASVTHHQPWWVAVPVALAVATLVAFVFGLIAVRTQGIYFLMITLALGMVVFAFANQNQTIFNGHTGINGIRPPTVAGVRLADPTTFYYLTLAVAALAYLGVRYLARTPFGLALQAVRDNPRRMRALGYWVPAHRVAAFTLAGFLAGVAGVLGTWYNGAISPATIDMTRIVNVLVIAVVGGIAFPEGAFVGALVFTLVTNFASSYTERYNTVIGLTFLLIVLFSPDGLVGLGLRAARLGRRLRGAPSPLSAGAQPRLPEQPDEVVEA
ncbi:MAG: branched-chain amino acid ABC transporter permease [Thermomicrobiaceae bacterium]|nr:branched-chain amino acid ABC transporter permease [Thermomicrobiaceae bacterium]